MQSFLEKVQSIPRLRPECVMCVVKKYAHRYPENASNLKKVEYMQNVFSIISKASKTTAIPVITRDIDDMRFEMFGLKDEYAEIKWHYNEMMFEQIDTFREKIRAAEDSLLFAMQLSLIGNYIDFAAVKNVNEAYLNEMLAMAHEKEFDLATFDRLKKDLEKGGKMAFFTDNCGEVVLDMLLIEEMKKQYPLLDITVIVKGQEAINDATMEDAKQIGLDRLVNVIGNGNNVGASWIPEMPENVIRVIEEADIIFSKGQANFETLRHCERNAYYLFLCKCDMFANQFQVEPFSGMFIHESDPKNGILE